MYVCSQTLREGLTLSAPWPLLCPLTLGAFGAEEDSRGHRVNELGLPNQPTLLNRVTLGNGLPLSELCSSPNEGTNTKAEESSGERRSSCGWLGVGYICVAIGF